MAFPRIIPSRWLSDQNYSMCSQDFLYPFYDTNSNYFRSWKSYENGQAVSKEFGSTIENDKGNYKITLDVQHFRPDDISVKVTNTEIIVEGKHEERQDTHGFISRHFKRRYPLPNHCPAENVSSTMSADGILTIVAEKISTIETEKIVPIKLCGATSRKIQNESKMTSEITSMQNSAKENIREDTAGDIMACTKDRTRMLLKEDHSRLLKPELLTEAVSTTNGEMSSKQVVEMMGLSEKKDATNIGATSTNIGATSTNIGATSTNIGATSTKIEESLAKSILGMSELAEQLGTKSLASTSDSCGIKGMSSMSKTSIEESSSTYKSSSSMSSTMKTSGKIGEYVSDIISAELKEAAENI